MSIKHPVPEDPVTEWLFWIDEKKASLKDRVKLLFNTIWREKK